MFAEEYVNVGNAAKAKAALLKNNPFGFFIAAMLAGIYVGFGVILSFSVGGQLGGIPLTRFFMGFSFTIALSLVVIAGAELFTGLNLVAFAGLKQKTIGIGQLAKMWLVCYLGNWLGSILVAILFWLTGLDSGAVGEFIANAAAAKMNAGPVELLARGTLCNTLVCLAVWCGFRCKSESAKLIMIFWCILAFITTGFEHSVANMTLLTISLLEPFRAAVSLSGYFYNIFFVTIGNMIGGMFIVALPYYLISRQKSV
ncbi:MAG: formate/nitrite transporter family protein [Treponema sp.]|nr:formate/nitrite transporter family protein [Treponema sp.]